MPLMCYKTTIWHISSMSLTREPLMKWYKESIQVKERSVRLDARSRYSCILDATDVFRCRFCQHLKENIIHLNPKGAIRKHCCDWETDAWNWNTFFQVLTNHTRGDAFMFSCNNQCIMRQPAAEYKSKRQKKIIIRRLLSSCYSKNYTLHFDRLCKSRSSLLETITAVICALSFDSQAVTHWNRFHFHQKDLSGQKRNYDFLPGYIPTGFQAEEESQEKRDWNTSYEENQLSCKVHVKNKDIKASLRDRTECV